MNEDVDDLDVSSEGGAFDKRLGNSNLEREVEPKNVDRERTYQKVVV